MRLMCLGAYSNGPRGLGYEPGLIEVTEEIGAFLLRDAPGTFEELKDAPAPPAEPTAPAVAPAATEKALEEPPRTTAMRRAPRGKAAG